MFSLPALLRPFLRRSGRRVPPARVRPGLRLESLETRAVPSASPMGGVLHHEPPQVEHHRVEAQPEIQIEIEHAKPEVQQQREVQPNDDRGADRRNDRMEAQPNDDRGVDRIDNDHEAQPGDDRGADG